MTCGGEGLSTLFRLACFDGAALAGGLSRRSLAPVNLALRAPTLTTTCISHRHVRLLLHRAAYARLCNLQLRALSHRDPDDTPAGSDRDGGEAPLGSIAHRWSRRGKYNIDRATSPRAGELPGRYGCARASPGLRALRSSPPSAARACRDASDRRALNTIPRIPTH